MRYDPHENLVSLARPTNEPGRLLVGCLAMIVIFFFLGMIYSTLEAALLPAETADQFRRDLATASTPASALVNLYLFALMIIALAVTLRLFHQRSLFSLIGPLPHTVWQFWHVIKAIVALYLAIHLLALFVPAPETMRPALNMSFGHWAALLPLTLLGLLIQTSAEELIFRGYLQSQLAARFAHPLIWLTLPTALFAALHYDPVTQGDAAWLIVVWAGAFGLAATDLTARSGTLGPAIALHMANNTMAIALTAPDGNFDGVALYAYPFALEDTGILLQWMPVEMMVLLCSWLAARLALRC